MTPTVRLAVPVALAAAVKKLRVCSSRWFVLVVLVILQVGLSLKMSKLEDWGLVDSAKHLFATTSSLVVMFLLIGHLLAKLPKNFAASINVFWVGLYLCMLVYHWGRHEPLTFQLIYKNGADIFNFDAVGFALSTISPITWAAVAFVVSGLVFAQWRWSVFYPLYKPKAYTRSVVILLLLNIVVAAGGPRSGNEFYEFSASMYRYFDPFNARGGGGGGGGGEPYPYYNPVAEYSEKNIADDPERPHVFIVMLESFSSLYMGRTENGKPVTPFLDGLRNGGVFVQEFFSTSVETNKGQFATLCGVYPSYRDDVFTSYADNNFRCLSHILNENGYINVFLKAYHSLAFQDTGKFVRANGYEHAHAMDNKFVTREEQKVGWGIQDDIFYQKTFEYLDFLEKEQVDQRYFVTTMSVTNHMMFDSIPKEQRYIYPDARTHHENYTNSMHLTDKYLREFFRQLETRDYLKNSLVLVLGDNGFPMGQHKNNYYNTKTAYNELFATPLLVLWPEKIEPQVLKDDAYSQLDVAPTILDILNIRTNNHFVGRSIFDARDESGFVPLIQPFDGTYLASIRYPLKFVKHIRTNREHLYNLAKDPREQHDIAADANQHLLQVNQMRADIERLHVNEVLLHEDRIYPPDGIERLRVRFAGLKFEQGDDVPYEILGELEDGHSLEVDIVSFSPITATSSKAIELLRADSIGVLPSGWFDLGFNRVSLRVLNKDQLMVAEITGDVFIGGERVDLLSEMNIEGRPGWGELRRDSSVLRLPLRIMGERFSFGLGTHASSEHIIELDQQYQWFTTQFGMNDSAHCSDGATFEIYTDDDKMRSQAMKRDSSIESATVSVVGRQSLRLITLKGSHDYCDHTNWVNPVLYKAEELAGAE